VTSVFTATRCEKLIEELLMSIDVGMTGVRPVKVAVVFMEEIEAAAMEFDAVAAVAEAARAPRSLVLMARVMTR
jgi:hypothetical protein